MFTQNKKLEDVAMRDRTEAVVIENFPEGLHAVVFAYTDAEVEADPDVMTTIWFGAYGIGRLYAHWQELVTAPYPERFKESTLHPDRTIFLPQQQQGYAEALDAIWHALRDVALAFYGSLWAPEDRYKQAGTRTRLPLLAYYDGWLLREDVKVEPSEVNAFLAREARLYDAWEVNVRKQDAKKAEKKTHLWVEQSEDGLYVDQLSAEEVLRRIATGEYDLARFATEVPNDLRDLDDDQIALFKGKLVWPQASKRVVVHEVTLDGRKARVDVRDDEEEDE